jgi:large subunit ribosomal protein L22
VDNAKYLAGEQGTDLDVDSLYVKQALANDGPRMKRIRPAPMGRAYRYQRRLAHIIVSVAERATSSHLVTKVEESAEATKPAKKAKPAVKAVAKKAKPAAAPKKKASKKA